MRYFFVSTVIWLFTLTLSAQEKAVSDIEFFRKKLAAESRQQESIECDFTQYRHLEIMDETLVSSGKFYFKREDMICLDYVNPAPYRIVLNGQKVKILSDGKKNVYDMSSNQQATAMKSMLASCLFGDFTGSESNYRMSVFEDESHYRVEIEPQNKRMKKYIRKIEAVFDKKNLSVDQLILREPSGDFTRQVFSDKKFNIPLSDQLFDIP